LGRTGSYVYAAQVAGYDYNALVNKILDVAVIRYFANTQLLHENGNPNNIPLHVKIRSFLRTKKTDVELLIENLVNINTYVRNIEGVNKVGMLIKKQLTKLGFKCEIIPQIELGNMMFFSNCRANDYDFVFLGNLDNSTRLSAHEYCQNSNQKISGTGIWEHKGGLAIMIHAFSALSYMHLLNKIKIGVLITSDDTLKGKFSKLLVEEKTKKAKFVIGLHGAFLNGGIVTSRSGSAVYNCQMSLKNNQNTMNVAQASAIFLKTVQRWTELSDTEEGLVIVPNKMALNTNITEPFAHCEVTLSVRFNKSEHTKKIDELLYKIIPKKYKEILNIQLEGGEKRPVMRKTEEVEEFYSLIKTIAEKLDIRLLQEHRWSSADICFVDSSKYMIDGFGPVGTKPSNTTEYILLHSILERAVLLSITMTEICMKNANEELLNNQ